MKYRFIFFSLSFLLFMTQFVSIANSQTVSGSFKFGFVKGGYEGSGDSIWLANSKKKDRVASKSVAALGADGSGSININGKDINLKKIKDFLPDKNFKVGRGGYEIWKGKQITVRIDYIFTWLCSPEDESCEVYYYKGVMDVTYKGQRRKAQIIGYGGS
jgi:hypothetical protein